MEDLGPCCICETEGGVRNIVMLNKKSPVPGHGWGCLVCGLPSDGASAVLCDPCLELYQEDENTLKFACRGYPAIDGRIPIDRLEGHHDHDMEVHQFEEECPPSEQPIGVPWS